MSLIDRLSDREQWEQFYEYKTSLACPKYFVSDLRDFIDGEKYRAVCGRIREGAGFPLPKRSVISKLSSDKKRIVYTYPYDENMVLKLLTYMMLRKYDGIFCDNLYSFRPGKTAKDAVRRLMRIKGIWDKYSYKVDISNYFNSVPVEDLVPLLENTLGDDRELCGFLTGLLREPLVVSEGKTIVESKGIMAGTPLSSFYANLYISDLDRHFEDSGVIYARYSDDIIVFADTEEEIRDHIEYIRRFLESKKLKINPEKEFYSGPGQGFSFLGFSCKNGVVDISPVTVRKLKHKMRRKTRALERWKKRNGETGERAAKAFIRIFNRKLLEGPVNNELTWSHWFFSVINTSDSLREIDLYAQDCIRYLMYGKHTKARFNTRYDDMKKLGYRNLVHAYYEMGKSMGDARP